MKKLRFAVKLAIPYCIFRIWAKRKYNIAPGRVGANAATRMILEIAPAFFALALSQRREDDRSTLKYFLPYSFMVKRVWRQYQMTRYNDIELDAKLETICPFGIILWRDSLERPHIEAAAKPAAKHAAGTPAPDLQNAALLRRINALHREMTLRMDRIELLLLRMATKE